MRQMSLPPKPPNCAQKSGTTCAIHCNPFCWCPFLPAQSLGQLNWKHFVWQRFSSSFWCPSGCYRAHPPDSSHTQRSIRAAACWMETAHSKKRDSAALSEQQPPCAIEAVAAPRNVHVVLIALYACSRSGRRAPSRLPPTVLPAVKVFFSPLADPKSRTTCSGGSRLLFKVDGFPRANHRLNGQPLSGRREPVALCTLHRHRFNGLASLMSDGRAVSAEQLAAGITLHQSNNTSVENTQEIQHIKNE